MIYKALSTSIRTVFVLFLGAACSYTTKFEKQELDYSVFQDVPPETGTPCKDDCGCTVFGPCYKCVNHFCTLPEGVDSDHDGHRSDKCDIDDSCARERNLPQNFWPRVGDDCDDSDFYINPGATDVCNAKDDDCDGLKDEDTSTYGPVGEGPVKLTSGYQISFCATSQNTLVIWQNDYPQGKVSSGFFDMDGNLFNPVILTENGKGPDVDCMPGLGAVSAWSDQDYGGTDIMVQKLDAVGAPQAGQDPIHFPDDSAASLDAKVACHGGLSMVGVVWLTHDTNVTAIPAFRVFDFYTLGEISQWSDVQSFDLPLVPPAISYEKTDIEDYIFTPPEDSDTPAFTGFAALWNTRDGIYFASITCRRAEMSCSAPYGPQSILDEPGDARFPDLEWAGDRFIVAYAAAAQGGENPSATTTTIKFVEIVPVGENTWQPKLMDAKKMIKGEVEGEYDEEIIEFGTQATYPALKWVDSLGEIVLAWGDGSEFGKRVIKFARFAWREGTGGKNDFLELVIDRIIDVSQAENFAGAPRLEYRPSPGAEGFVVGWTERIPTGLGVDVYTRAIRCRQ